MTSNTIRKQELVKQHVPAETMLELSRKIAIKLELKRNLVDNKLYKCKGKLLLANCGMKQQENEEDSLKRL